MALIVPAMLALVIVYGGRMTQTWRAIYSRVGFERKLRADRPHQIDMEARQPALAVQEVERRKVRRRQEAQAGQGAEVWLGHALFGPEHRHLRLCGQARHRRAAGEEAGETEGEKCILDRQFRPAVCMNGSVL